MISHFPGTIQLDSSVGQLPISRCGEDPGSDLRSGPAIPAQSLHMKAKRSVEAISRNRDPKIDGKFQYISPKKIYSPALTRFDSYPEVNARELTTMKFFVPIAFILPLVAASPAAVPRQGLATPSIVPGDVKVIGVSLLVCPPCTPGQAKRQLHDFKQ